MNAKHLELSLLEGFDLRAILEISWTICYSLPDASDYPTARY